MSFSAVSDTPERTLLDECNGDQFKAATSKSGRIICAAGAGTGKTFTLLARLQNLVGSEGVDPSSILVLTFTHAAACEFEARWGSVCETYEPPLFSTFHAFCYKLMQDDPNVLSALGFSTMPRVANEFEDKQMCREAVALSSVRLSGSKLSLSYKPRFSERREHELYVKTLRRLMSEKGIVTFDYMNVGVSRLFAEHDPVAEKYISRYTHVFVDEFQDTDPAQFAFLTSFEESSLFCVGDVHQALYGFRGADSSIMKSLMDSCEWDTLDLNENYRSTEQICSYANGIFDDNTYSVNLWSRRSGEDVKRLPKDEFLRNVGDWAHGLTGTTALIARTNRTVGFLQERLKQSEVGYTTSCGNDAFAVAAALDDRKLRGYLEMSLPPDALFDQMWSKYVSHDDIPLDQLMSLAPRAFERVAAIRNLPDFPRYADMYFKGADVQEIISMIYAVSEESDIYVGTVHSVKGLEFDNVFVYGYGSKEYDLGKEDERNVFYVACTRPKSQLVIIHE